MRYITRSALAVAAVALLAAAGCGDTDDGGSSSPTVPGLGGGGDAATVEVDDNLFEPETTEISAGDTVSWEWVGNEPHNVVGDDFESEIQQEGTFDHTFEDTGSYDYVCTIHPGMEGTVEVS